MSRLADRRKGIPAAALGQPEASKKSKLAEARRQIVRGEPAELPGGLGPVWIELLGHSAANIVEAGTLAEMDRIKMPAGNAPSIDLERQVRTLALAVRCDDNHDEPFGPLEDWSALDDDLIAACYLVYRDIRERRDPISLTDITPEQVEFLREALKKKDPASFLYCGARVLTAWLLTGDVQLSSSPTPVSSSGDTSPENSTESSTESA